MDFLNDVKTLEDRELLLSEVDAVKRKDYKSVRINTLDKIIELKDTLEQELKKLDCVKVTLAISPTIGILDSLDNFFKKNINKKVIFDIEVDPKIIGGLVVSLNGNYGDFSVLRKIEEED